MHTLIALAVAGVGVAISYGDPQGALPPARSQPQDQSRIICKDRLATGSRLAYARDCHTQAEWDVITRSSRDFVNGLQMRALNSDKPPGASGH